jgi:hypothetical protein
MLKKSDLELASCAEVNAEDTYGFVKGRASHRTIAVKRV